MEEYYDNAYFNRFEKSNPFQQFIIRFVDRKEPVLTYLKKHKPKGSTLLDVGCGNGRFLRYIQDYYVCTGLDSSDAAIKAARIISPQARYIQASAAHVAKIHGKFNIITCFDLIEHLNDFVPLLRGVYEKLDTNGVFVFSAPNNGSLGRLLKKNNWYGYKDKSHVWFKTIPQWKDVMKDAGFAADKVFPNGLMDPPYIKWVPSFLQTIFIKYFTQGLSLLGLPLPYSMGEIFFMVLHKV